MHIHYTLIHFKKQEILYRVTKLLQRIM